MRYPDHSGRTLTGLALIKITVYLVCCSVINLEVSCMFAPLIRFQPGIFENIHPYPHHLRIHLGQRSTLPELSTLKLDNRVSITVKNFWKNNWWYNMMHTNNMVLLTFWLRHARSCVSRYSGSQFGVTGNAFVKPASSRRRKITIISLVSLEYLFSFLWD